MFSIICGIFASLNKAETIMNIGDKAPEILGKDEQGRDIRRVITRDVN